MHAHMRTRTWCVTRRCTVQLGLAQRAVPVKTQLEAELLATQRELLAMQQRVAGLETDLESPHNATRFKRLEGGDLTEEQLQEKVERLSARLVAKEEQALEKDLVLAEVDKLVGRSTAQVRAGQSDTVLLAKTVNTYQMKIKDGNRKLMALVSELSMYQAQALQLQQQAHGRAIELEEAQARLDAGQPPTQEVGVGVRVCPPACLPVHPPARVLACLPS